MTSMLRMFAIAIAVMALVDPTLAVQRRTPLSLELTLPPLSDPDHASAQTLARRIQQEIEGVATLTSADPAAARVVLGNADIPVDLSAPVYFVPAAEVPARAAVTSVSAAGEVVPGQSLVVTAEVRGIGLTGRTSAITLLDRGVPVAETEHGWTAGNERLVTRLAYVPARAGVHRLTVRVRTPGVESDALADTAAIAVDRPLRVMIYEPRPSWAVAFVRRSLEQDPTFTLATLSRRGDGTATRAGASPRSLEVLDVDAFDVVVVGAPDALTARELASLDRFTSDRGGGLLLVPDRRLTKAVQERFTLPVMEEILLEKPVAVRADTMTVHASELLLARGRGTYSSLATPEGASLERAAIVSVARGEGTIVVSGLLDAWRHRRQQDGGNDGFWRGLVADLAVAVPRRLEMRVDPAVAQPGDRVRITASWRRDAIVRPDGVRVPPTSAAITDAAGSTQMIRLWPGARAGVFDASFIAPEVGLLTVTAAADGASADAILRVEPQVSHGRRNRDAAARLAAAASGGAVVRDVVELVSRLRAAEAPAAEATTHPMRSPFWLLPFAGCLCLEWFVRRRRGLR